MKLQNSEMIIFFLLEVRKNRTIDPTDGLAIMSFRFFSIIKLTELRCRSQNNRTKFGYLKLLETKL
jgi:hypothetical protein